MEESNLNNTNGSGKKYEFGLLKLILKKGIEFEETFKVGKDIQLAGKFDDLAIKYDEETKEHYIFVQVKHLDISDKCIDEDVLMSKKLISRHINDFNVVKYFNSYLRIKKQFENTNRILEKLVIYTNAETIDETIATESQQQNSKFYNLLNFNGVIPVWKLKKTNNIKCALLDQQQNDLNQLAAFIAKDKYDGEVLKFYQDALVREKILEYQFKTKKCVFHPNFINGTNLSQNGLEFREKLIGITKISLKALENWSEKININFFGFKKINDFEQKMITEDLKNLLNLTDVLNFNLNSSFLTYYYKELIEEKILECRNENENIIEVKFDNIFVNGDFTKFEKRSIGLILRNNLLNQLNLTSDELREKMKIVQFTINKNQLEENSEIHPIKLPTESIHEKDVDDFLNILELKIKQPNNKSLYNILLIKDVSNDEIMQYSNFLWGQIWKWKDTDQQKENWISNKDFHPIIKLIEQKTKENIIITKLHANKKRIEDIQRKYNIKFNLKDDIIKKIDDSKKLCIETDTPVLVSVLLFDIFKGVGYYFVPFNKYEDKDLQYLTDICNKDDISRIIITNFENNDFINGIEKKIILITSSTNLQFDKISLNDIKPTFDIKEILNSTVQFRKQKKTFNNFVENERFIESITSKQLETIIKENELQINNTYEKLEDYYLSRKFNSVTGTQNDETTLWNDQNRIIIVSGNSGIGKSTLLSNFAYKLSQEMDEDWVVKVNIGQVMSIFKSSEGIKMSNELQEKDFINEYNKKLVRKVFLQFLNGQTDFEKALIENALQNKGNIFILLDGLDEVPINYNIVKFVQVLSTNNFRKLILSSRPTFLLQKEINTDATNKNSIQAAKETSETLVEILQNKLNASVYVLKELTKDDQEEVLNRKYKIGLNSLEDKLKDTLKELLGNPLQLNIMAEACTENSKKINNKLELYDEYMENNYKKHIYQKSRLLLDERYRTQIFDILCEKSLEIYEKLALLRHFDSDTLKRLGLLRDTENLKESFTDFHYKIINMGITEQTVDNLPQFTHKTYADYFLAKYLYKFLQNSTVVTNKNLYRFLISDILTEAKYEETCSFLNFLLDKNNKIIHDVNLKDTNSTALLIAAKRSHDNIVEYLLLNRVDPNVIDMYFQTPLHNAVLHGSESTVELLLKYNADVNKRNNIHLTPLHDAVRSKKTVLIKSLLKCQTDFKEGTLFQAIEKNDLNTICHYIQINRNLNGIDNNKSNPLHYAVLYEREVIAEKLLKSGANVNSTNTNDQTALHWAVITEKPQMVALLLKHGAAIYSRDNFGCTPLHWSAMTENIQIVNDLLKYLPENYNLDEQDNRLTTALNYSVRSGRMEIAEVLLKRGAKCNVQNTDGNTAVHIGVIEKQQEIVEMLLRNNADVNILNKANLSPLHWAIRKSLLDMTKILLTTTLNGTEIQRLIENNIFNDVKDENKSTFLHYAALYGNVEMVLKSVENKSVNFSNVFHQTALHWAVAGGNYSVVKILLEKGADICAKDKLLCTPIHWASMTQHLSILQILLQHLKQIDEDINVCSITNDTPLHYSTKNGNEEMVEELLKENADCNLQNNKGYTPLHIAVEENYKNCVTLLLKYEADITCTDKQHYSPVHRAVLWNRKSILKKFLQYEPNNKLTPLHEACEIGDYQTVEKLLVEKHSVNSVDSKDSTPLHYAALNGSVKIMKLLLKYGASTNLKNKNKQIPYHWAVIMDHRECVDELLYQKLHEKWEDIFSYTPDSWELFRRTGKIDNQSMTQ